MFVILKISDQNNNNNNNNYYYYLLKIISIYLYIYISWVSKLIIMVVKNQIPSYFFGFFQILKINDSLILNLFFPKYSKPTGIKKNQIPTFTLAIIPKDALSNIKIVVACFLRLCYGVFFRA
jgi:hypothetical protein